MRGVKAKALRRIAGRLAAKTKRSYELAPGGGVSRYVSGYEYIYKALKRVPRSVRGL